MEPRRARPADSDSDAANAGAAEIVRLVTAKGANAAVGIQRAPGSAFYGNASMVIIATPLQENGNLPLDPRNCRTDPISVLMTGESMCCWRISRLSGRDRIGIDLHEESRCGLVP